jgi:hypothetical protein
VDQSSTAAGSARPARHRWHQAADQAEFTFFEPVGPRRAAVWAGGFGWGREGPTHLAILASIDGVEVEVATRASDRRSTDDQRMRLLTNDLLLHHVWDERSALELPMTIEVIADDRAIPVAGQDRLLSGVRIAGSGRWAGEVSHDSVVIRAVTSTYASAFSIEPCRDWTSMAEFPPTAPSS